MKNLNKKLQLKRRRNYLNDKKHAYEMIQKDEISRDKWLNFDMYSNIILDTLAELKEIEIKLGVIR